ncbi:MAG TPA: extracellular solute-binding protein [Gemmataceae bacterium]|nr:extracellular solute-binding protein [Gemmataceae bacterium]
MLSRFSPAILALGSLLALAGLVGALYVISNPGHTARDAAPPLEIYCAAAMAKVVEVIGKDYEVEYGQKVNFHPGPSQAILVRLEESKKGDLFLPADDSYVSAAEKKQLVSNIYNVATMQAVVIVRPGLGREIKTWYDFLATGSNLGLANPDATAMGKLTKRELQGLGLWAGVEAVKPSYLGDINEVGNSVALVGSSDVGITWDPLAHALQQKKPGLKIVRLKELAGINARVKIALVKASTQPELAKRFVTFLRAKGKGADRLKEAGYADVDEAEAMDGKQELVVYAGSMLRPAIEESLNDFEKIYKCRVSRIYNGCGILVGQMQVGQVPDIYFACDTSFMVKVKDKFEAATSVSNNQLVIVVHKGNPKNIRTLADLGKPGLRVGIGHEQQCAMGALTKETFLRTGTYGKIAKNVIVQSPTGDFLVNQMMAGGEKGLDVVVAYRSNIIPYTDKVEGIPIEGIACALPQQPIAVARSSKHPELSRRLAEFLQTRESRERFEKFGFGWEVKEVE